MQNFYKKHPENHNHQNSASSLDANKNFTRFCD